MAALAAGNPVVAADPKREAVNKAVGVDLGVSVFVIEYLSPPYDFGALARWSGGGTIGMGNRLEQPND